LKIEAQAPEALSLNRSINLTFLQNRRVLVLILLAALTLLYRGLEIYQVSRASKTMVTEGFATTVHEGYLTVSEVMEGELFGQTRPAARAGLQTGDRILSAYSQRGEGGPIGGYFDYGDALRDVRRGEPWRLDVSRESAGEWIRLTLTMPPGPADSDPRALIMAVAFSVLLPMVAIITALFIGFMRPENNNAFLASLLFLSFSTVFGGQAHLFPSGFKTLGVVYQVALNGFLVYLFMLFFLRFPSPSWIDRTLPKLKWLFLGVTAVFWIGNLVRQIAFGLDFQQFQSLEDLLIPSDRWFAVSALAMFSIGLTSLVMNTVGAKSRDEQRRMVILLIGTAVGLLPLTVYLIILRGFSEGGIPPWWLLLVIGLTLAFFPLSFFYVVVRHRVLGIRLIIRRGLQYALVSRAFLLLEFVVIFTVLFIGFSPFFSVAFPDAGDRLVAFVTALLTVGAVFGVRRINSSVMPVIDRYFFREAYDAQKVLTDLSRSARRLAVQPDKLIETVAQTISDSFYAAHVGVFLADTEPVPSRPGREAWRRELIRYNPRNRGDFRLYLLRSRRPDGAEIMRDPPELQGLKLSSRSFITQYLEQVVRKEPEPVEVYLNDPKSWAHALTRAGSGSPLYRERELLERLRTHLIVPLIAGDNLFGFISVGEKLSEESFSRQDKELLMAVAEQTAVALDYSHLIGELTEQERFRREIEIATEVQTQLFPQVFPRMKSLEYTGLCKPARGVGGDYYDFLDLGAGQLCMALGDISGKGISAALLMASLQALLRSNAPRREKELDKLVGDINQLMCPSTDGSKYATFFCCLYNDHTRTLDYVNAGHNPPFVFRPADSTGPALPLSCCPNSDNEHPPPTMTRLDSGGTVIGLFPEAEYRRDRIQFWPGDTLLIFSDGVTEAFDVGGEEFGEDRLAALVSSRLNLSAAELGQLILNEVETFADGTPHQDDITLVVAKVVPSGA
jgi:phosphoserine phosphatase RsbU/P